MNCDHRLGYAPAASPGFTAWEEWGLAQGCTSTRNAIARPPRRWVDMSCMTAGDAAAAQAQACNPYAPGDPHPGRPLVLITDTAMQGVLTVDGRPFDARTRVLYEGAMAAADICQGLEGAALRRAVAEVHEAGRQAREHHALQQAKEAEHQAFLRAHAARQSNPYFRDVPVFEPCKVGVAGLDDAHVPDWQDGG
jgi:hypothetical protein